MKKIIVTGGCGYIGSHTTIELIENDFEVVIFDDLSNSSEKTLERIEKITGVRPIFEKIDLKDQRATECAFDRYKDARKAQSLGFDASELIQAACN